MAQNPLPDITAQAAIMEAFAARTGLGSDRPARRYLWTDAFALCNFLGLYRATGQARYRDLALALIVQVHRTLGRFGDDDPRTGWISGLSEEEGARHPLAGGLRIGKPMQERAPDAPYDAAQEWDRDGQYFHYLTKWMHALSQAGCVLGRPEFVSWALELARVAHRAFVYRRDGHMAIHWAMHWKMRIDLSAPLVASMGQHDPLDGLVTCRALAQAARCAGLTDQQEAPLAAEIADYWEMTRASHLLTDDPLGLGGLLFDAARLIQTGWQDAPHYGDLCLAVLEAAEAGLGDYLRQGHLGLPAAHRLAFRELGLAIGLAAPARFPAWAGAHGTTPPGPRLSRALAMGRDLGQYRPVRAAIETFWRAPENQRAESWRAHEDINAVMLATSLAPEGFLSLTSIPEPKGSAHGNQ